MKTLTAEDKRIVHGSVGAGWKVDLYTIMANRPTLKYIPLLSLCYHYSTDNLITVHLKPIGATMAIGEETSTGV